MNSIKYKAWNKVNHVMHHDILNPNNWSFSFLNQDIYKWLQCVGDRAVSNNQEVYEGDVCMVTYKTPDETFQLTGTIVMYAFSWCLQTEEETYPIHQLTIIDVYGNIYENKELITN